IAPSAFSYHHARPELVLRPAAAQAIGSLSTELPVVSNRSDTSPAGMSAVPGMSIHERRGFDATGHEETADLGGKVDFDNAHQVWLGAWPDLVHVIIPNVSIARPFACEEQFFSICSPAGLCPSTSGRRAAPLSTRRSRR